MQATALQIAESKYAKDKTPEVLSALNLLRLDAGLGTVIHRGVRFRPLTDCNDPAEMGCLQKVFELAGVSQIIRENVKPKYKPLAKRLEGKAKELKGPISMPSVWYFSIARQEDSKTVLGVVLKRNGGSVYGYFFHLKAAAFLCGMK